jgi:hypothetical protein
MRYVRIGHADGERGAHDAAFDMLIENFLNTVPPIAHVTTLPEGRPTIRRGEIAAKRPEMARPARRSMPPAPTPP